MRIEQGVGTPLVRDYATYSFTPNGQMASMTDARGYKASMLYDGFDRQSHWYFPQPNQTGAINPNDYELYGYDANGNRTSLRKRDGTVLTYQYDNLNRMIRKTVPERSGLSSIHTRDVFYQYDIRGLQLWARFGSDTGPGSTSVYDRYGRVTSTTDNTGIAAGRTLNYTYDAGSNRTSVRHTWDNALFSYTYSSGGQFNQLRDPSNLTLVDYNYNTDGELSSAIRYSSAPDQSWTYDPIGRMASTMINAPGTSYDVTWSFTRNAANQIRTESQSNDSFSWDGYQPVNRGYTTNGLNQYTAVSGQAYCHDPNGNLTADGQYVYLYDVENRLVEMRAQTNSVCTSLSYSGQIKAELRYDPMGRLYQVTDYVNGVSQGARVFLHDGDALVAEFNASGTVLARHAHGPAAGVDDPLVSYNGASISINNARFLQNDARGSIVYSSDRYDSAASRVINTYDEYGQPGAGNEGRFQYTGQVWLSELGMYYYKARIYSPALGRFMQTDPIGYEDNVNLYGYVGQDPVNRNDPTGKRDVYVGGLLDRAVRRYVDRQKERFPDRDIRYVQHYEGSALRDAISEPLKDGEPLNVIAHSIGGREAIRAADDNGVAITNLMTVDPVGSTGANNEKVLANTGTWTNVDAEPPQISRDFSDGVRAFGERTLGKTDTTGANTIETTANHGNFEGMMQSLKPTIDESYEE